jgi:hypothetical protein
MTIAAVTSSALTTLIAEFAPEKFQNAINLASPLIASNLLEKENVDGKEIEVTLMGGGISSTAWVSDNGTLPLGAAYTPVIARALPSYLVSQISMGRGATLLNLDDKGFSSLLDGTLDECAAHCGQVLGRGLHGGSIAPQAGTTWSGTAANSTASVDFTDISLFRPGAAVDYLDATSNSFVVRVTTVTPAAKGSNSDAVAGTVGFINDVPNPATGNVVALTDTTIATGDSFRTRGETAGFGGALTVITGQKINSFDDMAGPSGAATASFMGVTAANFPGWAGNSKTLSAAYSQEAMVSFMGRIFQLSGFYPDVVVMPPQVAAAHVANTGVQASVWGTPTAAYTAARPMNVDRSADKFGNVYEDGGLRVGGAKIVQDPNCIATRIECFNSKKTKLAVWKEMSPAQESGDPILLGRTTYSNQSIMEGAYQFYTTKRATVGVVDSITGL